MGKLLTPLRGDALLCFSSWPDWIFAAMAGVPAATVGHAVTVCCRWKYRQKTASLKMQWLCYSPASFTRKDVPLPA